MLALPGPLQPLAGYRQFILWTLAERDGKQVKLPVDYRTASVGDAHDHSMWLDADEAVKYATLYGDGFGVGFVFTEGDPFFFVDLDKCLLHDNTWSPVATEIMNMLPGAAIEVSQSGRGLHIFGKGVSPDHACKNVTLGLELYTSGRFVALTGNNMVGSADVDCTNYLPALVNKYFPPREAVKDQQWTTEPVAQWTGETDDDLLIEKARKSGGQSALSVFGDRASFADLWDCNNDALSVAYPDPEGKRTFDGSSADAALAQHLAFWTGNNCERILTLMKRSGLVRDKWERVDYLIRTITNAVSMQAAVYSIAEVDDSIAQAHGGVSLRATSQSQRDYATNIRAAKLIECAGDIELIEQLCQIPTAKFWINNKDRAVDAIAAMVTPVDTPVQPLSEVSQGPTMVSGYQYLAATQQIELFKGCTYVQSLHKVLTPNGSLLKTEQFNATYGGYTFQLDEGGDKVTRKAWEAFTESQVVRWPMAEMTTFRPELEPGILLNEDGQALVNSYVKIDTPRTPGDPAPFLTHLSKVLPVQRDRDILLAYMAACIQYKGVKFQWAPLLQGAEGNGKTLFTRCVAFALGQRYTHFPPATEISEKFNEWLFGKLFIGIEDVYVPDHKKEVIEVLKPMITNDKLAMRAMQSSQVMGDNRANFMLNSNHKDAIRKSKSDRRYSIFYTAQQNESDLQRDGMNGDYFPTLYQWLKTGGYAIVADYLHNYAIPDELNPATQCHRAPDTSSTQEAVTASLGGIEQDILEAVEEGRPGFAGGWISSVAIDRLLVANRLTRAIPVNKRREMLQGIGYDWHPALPQGRVNNPIIIDDGKKPRLFIPNGHINGQITAPAEVAKRYQDAQGRAVGGHNVAQVFS